jgi:hypothetical protein
MHGATGQTLGERRFSEFRLHLEFIRKDCRLLWLKKGKDVGHGGFPPGEPAKIGLTARVIGHRQMR